MKDFKIAINELDRKICFMLYAWFYPNQCAIAIQIVENGKK